jgi:hypothetical protein
MLLAEGGVLGRAALLLNFAAIALTSDFPLALLGLLSKEMSQNTASLGAEIRMVLCDRPVPIVLLTIGCFYLAVYVRRCREETSTSSGLDETTLLERTKVHPFDPS